MRDHGDSCAARAGLSILILAYSLTVPAALAAGDEPPKGKDPAKQKGSAKSKESAKATKPATA